MFYSVKLLYSCLWFSAKYLELFLWDGKMEAKSGFQGGNTRASRGKVPVGPAVLQGNTEETQPPPTAPLASSGGLVGIPLAELPPSPEMCFTKPHGLALLSFFPI